MAMRMGWAAGLVLLAGLLAFGQTFPTGDVQMLNLATAEFEAYAITVNVAGVEIFGFRFGASPQDIARAVAREIASRVGWQCRGSWGTFGVRKP